MVTWALNRVTFRVKRWLDDEEFRELLEFSDYIGRISGYSVFEVNTSKMRRAGYTFRDILAKLRDIEGIVDEDLSMLEERVRDELRVEVYLHRDGWLRIRSKTYLKPLMQKLKVYLPYDRQERAYKAPAHMYSTIVKRLEDEGMNVDDKIGLLRARLPRRIEFQGRLRPYQEEALGGWRKNGYRGVIALPTGAGKTVIAIAGIAELEVTTLIVVYTIEHIKQWIEAIDRFTNARGLVGAYYGEEKRLAPITITTYQSAYKKLDALAGRYALVVFDEAHHLPADKFRAIALNMPAPYRLGLSATIKREDGKHEEIFPLVGGIVYHTSPGELTRQGYLASYRIIPVRVDLDKREADLYKKLRTQYQALARGRTFDEILEAAKRGDQTAIQALKIHAEMRNIIQYSEAKIRKVEQIVSRELKRGSKIIVFTQYRRQAEEIARRVNGLLLHGGLDDSSRQRVLRKFKEADSGVLIVTTVGDEGLDIPDANVGVLVSGTGSPRQFIQRLGRLLRPGEGKKAVLYEVIVSGTSEEAQARKRRRLS